MNSAYRDRESGFVSNLALAFDVVVSQHADRPALFYPDSTQQVSYRELAALAEAMAQLIHGRGVHKGDVVAMLHDKSPAAFAAMLACLRLGITYTNLDPDSPWPRLQKILHTCQPRLIINTFAELPLREFFNAEYGTKILDLRNAVAQSGEALPDKRDIDGGMPAYIMFTSGSTGIPKGAVISHANLLWFSNWSRERFAITSQDVIANVNPIYFDNSVFDFYSAIFSGAALVPFTPAQTKEPRQLVRLVNQARCTIWFSVPSLLVYLLTTRALTADDFPTTIRKIIFGGEGFPKAKLRQLYDLFGNRAELENVYGPTECTCICSAHTIVPDDFADMQQLTTLEPLAQNFDGDILPLDESNPEFGELFLRGPQVGLGYYNDPECTARSFIQNPRHTRYLDIGYRTGDLVLRDAQGRLHFKGRTDFQIKHMGYRIELEEIEAALGTLSGVTECAVIYQKLGDGLGQILGFSATDRTETAETILLQLAALLPTYMLPRRIHLLESLPKNANGKIDRPALLQLIEKETAS